MFKKFKAYFSQYTTVTNVVIDNKEIPFKYTELLLDVGGVSYNKGLYTIHTFESSLKWAKILSAYFEGYKNEILPFAFDWWGRQYCVPKKGYESIYVFDPIDLKDYFLEENLIDFHNITLVDDTDLLDSAYFQEALHALKIDGIKQNKCIGYKIPLFLNGNTDLLNLQIVDIEVYWDTQHQIYNQIKDLPDGTRINAAAIIAQFKNDDGNI